MQTATSSHSLRLERNAPNCVTALRVVLAAVIGHLLCRGEPGSITAAGILLIIAASTDTLDGLLSRRLGQQTTGERFSTLWPTRFSSCRAWSLR